MPPSPFQPINSGDYLLNKNQIDIWKFSLHELPKNAFAILDKEEQIRAQRFHFSRHQRRFIVARSMLRRILAHYLQMHPAQLNFEYQKQGKPFLEHSAQVEFNLSHSQDMALLAVGQNYPLGVDIEYFSERPYDGIAEKLFSPTEIMRLSQQPAALHKQNFFSIWSQKEAFIKANGMGLSFPTQKFTVPIDHDLEALVYDEINHFHWKMVGFMPDKTSCAALCFNPKVTTLRMAVADPQQMISV